MGSRVDHGSMDCDHAQDSISARMDGELASDLALALDEHLAGCRACRGWESDAYALRRSVTMRRPLAPAGLSDQVTANLHVPNLGTGQWVRYALGVLAAAIVVVNTPLLFGLQTQGPIHESRHLGTFGVALGIGLMWAAYRPERANGLVPLAGALAATTVVGAVFDLAVGQAQAVAEATHLLELAGLGLLWHLSGGHHRLRRRLQARRYHRLRAA